MTWKVEWHEDARKELRKLNNQLQRDILEYLKKRIAAKEDPKRFGKPFLYDKYALWRYRVQDAWIICRIEEDALVVLVVKVGHRKDVYN